MEFLRPKRASAGLDLAPLIDCMFLLLIFFMLSSSFMNPALKLKLPAASTRQMPESEPVVLSIDDAGQIFLNRERVPLDNLRDALGARLQRAARKQVSFQGDQNMRYQLFVQVMDIARQAGAEQLNIVHRTHER